MSYVICHMSHLPTPYTPYLNPKLLPTPYLNPHYATYTYTEEAPRRGHGTVPERYGGGSYRYPNI
jgi:hypothetical protein